MREYHAANLIGQSTGLLTVISQGRMSGKHRYWVCMCSCGKQKEIRGDVIVARSQKSCGCLTKLILTTHGMSDTRMYSVWKNMMRRCFDPKNHAYKNYGGRGITVCDRWKNFENFYSDMGEPPNGKSLDRKDNSLGYSPENCRWATRKEQTRNMRTNRLITIDSETKSLAEWCEIMGQPYSRINHRIFCGMDPIAALLERRDMRFLEARDAAGN